MKKINSTSTIAHVNNLTDNVFKFRLRKMVIEYTDVVLKASDLPSLLAAEVTFDAAEKLVSETTELRKKI